MSLTLQTPVTTVQGFEVSDAYGRVSVLDNYQGTQIQGTVDFYVSEQAYLDGASALQFNGLYTQSLEPYDRNVMTTDVLDLAHDNLIAGLAQQNIVAVKNL